MGGVGVSKTDENAVLSLNKGKNANTRCCLLVCAAIKL